MNTINIDQIIRTDRKTIALIVGRDGKLMVRAPKDATNEQILSVVERKSAWIMKKQQEVIATYPQTGEKEVVNGEGFLYLGQSYRLKIIDHEEMPLRLDDFFYLDRSALFQAKEVFIHWYKEKANEVISERVAWYSDKIGIQVKQIKITSAKTRWGSCSAKGTVSFPWRLVMAPVPVIDYVVVHELVHVFEKNHSKAFWDKVRAIVPDYQQKIRWLEVNGHILKM
ncbi:MAG: SprT family zinc-dependent metalloprotease [Smithella sp.]|nr:SprT family zinc-dependent metalloprotease [Smithella sp.]